jgi:hypothetical protein
MIEIGSFALTVPVLWWASRARQLRWLRGEIADAAIALASFLEFPAEVRHQRELLRRSSNRLPGSRRTA